VGRLVALITAALWLAAAPASGAGLDPSFGRGGLTSVFALPDRTQLHQATDVAVQPDGKIVATAESIGGQFGDRVWTVVRFLPDGRLDPAFGSGGGTSIRLGAANEARAVALQPDGKILVTGSATCEQLELCFGVARLNADGSLDTGFGAGGMARHDPIRRADARDVAVQPDGRIVLVGRWYKGGDAQDDDVGCVMRLLPDGRLDTSFSRDGVLRLDHGHGDDDLTAVAIQGRRVVVAGPGRFIFGSRGSFAVARLRPDGALDRSFGRRGRRLVSFGRRRWASAVALAMAPSGRLVVAGNAGTGIERWQPALARLTRGGALDRRFGSGGRVRTRLPFGGDGSAVVVDPRGRVVIAGRASEDGSGDEDDWMLARYTVAGRPDPAFAPGGVLRSDFSGGFETIGAAAPDGDRIVVAGRIGSSLVVARYLAP
jgi:uncharacterized delta-60 repeat protein